MEISSGLVRLRHFRKSDAKRMAILANNPKIGKNLRDGFPYPYTIDDARNFLKTYKNSPGFFAIEYKEEYVGNISLLPLENVHRKTAEIGYFLAEPYWNKGIMTIAVQLITDFGFKSGFARIHTGVYEYNAASQKVLQKNDYTLEGIFRKNVFKEGKLWDEFRYARIHPDII